MSQDGRFTEEHRQRLSAWALRHAAGRYPDPHDVLARWLDAGWPYTAPAAAVLLEDALGACGLPSRTLQKLLGELRRAAAADGYRWAAATCVRPSFTEPIGYRIEDDGLAPAFRAGQVVWLHWGDDRGTDGPVICRLTGVTGHCGPNDRFVLNHYAPWQRWLIAGSGVVRTEEAAQLPRRW